MLSTQQLDLILKQLPPSSSTLRLLDVGGTVGEALRLARPDITPVVASLRPQDWDAPTASYDAIVAVEYGLDADFLGACLVRLREGGRLVVLNPHTPFDVAHGQTLEQASFVRLLIESAAGGGVLIRGERAHTTSDTLARVAVAGASDADAQTLATYTGRFVHVLVQQTPNKPVWRLTDEDVIKWQAVVVAQARPRLLGFSSLPKAVGWMQAAVLRGWVRDVNKVAKFRKEVLAEVLGDVAGLLLNPTPESLFNEVTGWIPLDPSRAERPDE